VILEVQGLTRHFGGIKALDGSISAWDGASSRGSSAPTGPERPHCSNVITGIYRPDRGAVSMEGGEITGLPPDEISRRGSRGPFRISVSSGN